MLNFHSNNKIRSLEEEFINYTEKKSERYLLRVLQSFFKDEEISLFILYYLKSTQDVEEVKSQIAQKIYDAIPKTDIEHFRGWIFKVIRNHCYTYLKTKQKKTNITFVGDIYTEFMDFSDNQSPIDEEQNEKKLHEAIASLPDLQEIAIRLHYFQNLKYAQIAEEMNVPENKVKSYIQNGKRNLSNKLKNTIKR